MQEETTVFHNNTTNSGKGENPKKIIIGISTGCIAIALIIGAFFFGKAMTKDDSNGNNNDVNANIASELAFVQADLANTQQRLQESERALAETTGQSALPEKSLEEQLQEAIRETGSNAVVGNVNEIENSPIRPFQIVTAGVSPEDPLALTGSGGALFWRNGTSGTWHLFMRGMQSVPICERFSNFAKPFAGFMCDYYDYDSELPVLTTVGEYFNVL